MRCYGGSCATGSCAASQSLIAELLDVIEHADVETSIGNLVRAGKGCVLCDRVAKIPPRQKRTHVADDDVRASEKKLTQAQAKKAGGAWIGSLS